MNTTISINHLLSVTNKLYKYDHSFEFYFERISVLKNIQLTHMAIGDMAEIYNCKSYFQNFKNVIEDDIELIK